MELEPLIGARLVAGFPGTEASPALIAHLRALHISSIIVFARNFTSVAQFTRLLRDLESGVGRRLLVMVDHEGGRIIRFSEGVTRFPAPREAARRGDAAIEAQGRTEAAELGRLGIHVNLAPCVDVLTEGSDPVIGDRAYGSDPAVVSRLGAARVRGLQDGGVAACAKHFPGLGAVARDPHKDLPTIRLDRDAMRRTHWPPFQAAVAARVATIMSSHVCYPELGEPEGLPATFSPRLVSELLRQTFGFEGAILTDDLEMGALRSFGGMGDIAVRACEAGHDFLLICSDLAMQREAFAGLLEAASGGRLSPAAVQAGANRAQLIRSQWVR